MIKFAKGALIAAMLIGGAAPALAATNPAPDKQFYVDFLSYIKSDFAFEGASYAAFQELNLSPGALSKLSVAWGDLQVSQLALMGDLQNITHA